jgi:hypothetical protein
VVGVVAAFIGLAAALGAFNRELTTAEKTQRTLNEVNKEAARAISAEKAAVEPLIATLRDETKSREQKAAALQQLNKIAPEYFGNLKAEEITVDQVNAAYDRYIENLLRAARAKAAEEKLIANDKEALDLAEKSARLAESKVKQIAQINTGLGANASITAQAAATERELIAANNKAIEVNAAQKKALIEMIQANTDLVATQKTAATTTANFGGATKEAAAKAKVLKEVLSDINNVLERQKLLLPKKKNGETIFGSDDIIDQAEAIENGIKKLLDNGFLPASEAVQNLKKDLQSLFKIPAKFDEIPGLQAPGSVASVEPADKPKAVAAGSTNLLGDLGDQLDLIDQKAQAFGNTQNVVADKLAATKAAIEAAINDGYSPLSNTVVALTELYAQFNAELQKSTFISESISAVADVISGLGSAIAGALESGANSFKEFAKIAIDAIAAVISKLIQLAVANAFTGSLKEGAKFGPIGVAIAASAGVLAGALFKKLVGGAKFARGTAFASGGLSLVGENGPELMNVPRGAQIASNPRTNRMLNSMGGGIALMPSIHYDATGFYITLKREEQRQKRVGG